MPLDLAFFYLDDGVLAGDVWEVARALEHVQRRAAELGLQLNLGKCEVVGAGRLSESALVGVLPPALLYASDGSSRFRRSFDLLGAAVGDADFVAAHCSARIEAAAPLLEAIGGLEDAQVSLRLLRSCAGHTRLVHTMRRTPPSQLSALDRFDSLVRECFAGFTGLHLDAAQLEQASRDFAHGGLGLRSTVRDAPAAYLASVGGSFQACCELDASYGATPLGGNPYVASARLVQCLPPPAHCRGHRSCFQAESSHLWKR